MSFGKEGMLKDWQASKESREAQDNSRKKNERERVSIEFTLVSENEEIRQDTEE